MVIPEDVKKYVSGWKKRKRKKEARLKRNQEEAYAKAKQIADLLKNKYAIKKVILFGSTVTGKYWEQSDIDIAILGLDDRKYMDIIWEASQIALPFSLDIVPLESATKSLKRKIEREGVEI